MKIIYYCFCIALLFVSCQPKVEGNVHEAFLKNSETVIAILNGFENENIDYSLYAKDYVMRDTGFGQPDSLSLENVQKNEKFLWENYDFKLVTKPLILLPGVNVETKKPDGSVRCYADWEITIPATDSTEAKSGIIKLYESFDFNEEGKVTFQQVYGDFTGIFSYLHN